MANVDFNILLDSMSGRLENVVFVNRNGKTHVRRRPIRKKPYTAKQIRAQQCFAQAVALTKADMADPAKVAEWEEKFKAQKGKQKIPTAYLLALSFYQKQMLEMLQPEELKDCDCNCNHGCESKE